MKKTKKLPPVHPGEILLEELMKPYKLSANKLSLELRVPSNRIVGIVNGQRSITAHTALRLSHYFGISAQFWMNAHPAQPQAGAPEGPSASAPDGERL